jgi:nucleotide-binding universal stress UspA family protein
MKRILVPTDFSDHADSALRHAVALAQRDGAALELLLSIHFSPLAIGREALELPHGFVDRLWEEAQERLGALAESLRAQDLTVEYTVVGDLDTASAICGKAEACGADLIAMGTRGLTGLQHAFLGSVAERTARFSPCPVLTSHEGVGQPGAYDPILVPTDFSDDARAALEWVREFIGDTPTRVCLLHVLSVMPLAGDPELYARGLAQEPHAQEIRGKLTELAAEMGVEAETRVERGHAERVVVDVAAELDAGLIAVGSRGHTGLAHVLLGSTAERVLQLAQSPVVVVKQKEGA